MAGGDSLVAHPRVCRPRSGRCRRIPGRRCPQCSGADLARRGHACSGDWSGGWTRHTVGVVHRPPPGTVPDVPGSYQFVDKRRPGALRGQGRSRCGQRINSYFQDPFGLPPRTAQMVEQADHVEWMVVDSESEALLLEHNLIKRHQPRYNVRLKDDKSYPWLAVTVSDEWPRPPSYGDASEAGSATSARTPTWRHQGHPRPAAPHLPAAELLRRKVPATPAARAPVSPLPHRPLLGTVRRRGRPGGVRPDGRPI